MFVDVDPETMRVMRVMRVGETPDPGCSKWRSVEVEDDPDFDVDTLDAFCDEQGQIQVRLNEDKLDAKRRVTWGALRLRRRAKH